MQDHQILHASTIWDGAVSRIIFRLLWPNFYISTRMTISRPYLKYCLFRTTKYCMQVQSGMVDKAYHIYVTVTYFSHLNLHQGTILSGLYLKYCFMQDDQTLHACTNKGDGVSRAILWSLWPTFYIEVHTKRNIVRIISYLKYRFI